MGCARRQRSSGLGSVKTRLLLVVLALVSIALAPVACKRPPPTPVDCSQWKWQDVAWSLQAYGTPGKRVLVLAGTQVTAQFIGEGGRVAGTAGCNAYFGEYSVENCTLHIGEQIATTKMSCAAPIIQQEQNYLALLKQAGTFVVSGANKDQLTITCGKQELVFKLIPNP